MSTDLVSTWGVDLKEKPLSLASEARSLKGAGDSADMLSQAVCDRYRCPDDFLNFVLGGKLSSDESYFRFGSDTTCYGRSCLGTRKCDVESCLSDTLKEVVVSDGRLTLPFDPTEIIDNLRLERYAHGHGGFQGIFRKLHSDNAIATEAGAAVLRTQLAEEGVSSLAGRHHG